MTLATFMPVFLVVLAVFAIAVAAMAVGVMFKRPCLRGSCGGAAVTGPGGEKLGCANCPSRHRRDAAQRAAP